MTERMKMVKIHGGYHLAFTEQQNEMIRKDLLNETLNCAVTIGMRKTSVEQLTEAVGIAKGSFYKFFPSKEMVFFAAPESIQWCVAPARNCLSKSKNCRLAVFQKVAS